MSRVLSSTVIAAVISGMSVAAQAPRRFEVASVKVNTSGAAAMNFGVRPGQRFATDNMPLLDLITIVHQVFWDFQVVDAPDWVRTMRVDINAKAPEGVELGALATDGPPT